MRLALVVCLLMVTGGCSNTRPSPGPLRVDDPKGGLSMTPPEGHEEWWGTVGSILLCPEKPVRLVRVTPAWDAEPRDHRVTVHRFAWTQRLDSTATPVGSAKGKPPAYAEPYADIEPMTGTYTRDLDGLVVRDPCGEDGKPGKVVNEILVSMLVGPEGGEFHRLRITYEADGREYTKTLENWWYTACGTATTQPRVCPPGQHAPGVAPRS